MAEANAPTAILKTLNYLQSRLMRLKEFNQLSQIQTTSNLFTECGSDDRAMYYLSSLLKARVILANFKFLIAEQKFEVSKDSPFNEKESKCSAYLAKMHLKLEASNLGAVSFDFLLMGVNCSLLLEQRIQSNLCSTVISRTQAELSGHG